MIAAIIVAVLVSRVILFFVNLRFAVKWNAQEIFHKFLMAAGVSFVPLRHE